MNVQISDESSELTASPVKKAPRTSGAKASGKGKGSKAKKGKKGPEKQAPLGRSWEIGIGRGGALWV